MTPRIDVTMIGVEPETIESVVVVPDIISERPYSYVVSNMRYAENLFQYEGENRKWVGRRMCIGCIDSADDECGDNK